jgi:hypothetical protein
MRKAMRRTAEILLFAFGLIALIALFRPQPAHALCNGLLGNELTAIGFETLTVSSTAKTLTATVYAPSGLTPAKVAIISVETNQIRFRVDGVAPTSSVGQLVAVGNQLEVCGQNAIQALQMIRQPAADATIMVHYYKVGQ